jgi:hypothetical protein
MSWSLKIRNGDLDVANAQLGAVRGADKLVQDFTCALLEARGNDDMQPDWGSYLDGGIAPDGTLVPGVVGSVNSALTRMAIESEIRRVASVIQQRQLHRVKNDRLTYNKVTLTAAEILVAVTDVRIFQTADELTVLVTLQTGAGTSVDIALPISDNSLVGS